MRILIITQEDPFYVPIYFNELFKQINLKEYNIVGVSIQETLGKQSILEVAKQMFNFYGLRDFIIMGFKYIVYKILSLIADKILKGNFPGCFSIEHILLKYNINKLELPNINSKSSLEILKGLELDVIISLAASQIFKKPLLELPKLGCYNIHNSKLPKNRGFLPTFWALYNYDKDPTSATTIHKMNEKLDDGDILLQEEFKLNPEESLEDLIIKTKRHSAKLTIKALELLKRGDYYLTPNDGKLATYNKFPEKEDVKKFKLKGLKLR